MVLNDGAVHTVPAEGYFMVYRSGSPAEHHCMGIRSGNGATILISQRNCTTTAGNAGTLNIYDTGAGGNYAMAIQNRTGSQMTIKYTMIGAVSY